MAALSIYPLVQVPRSYVNEQGGRVFPLDYHDSYDYTTTFDPTARDVDDIDEIDDDGDIDEPEQSLAGTLDDVLLFQKEAAGWFAYETGSKTNSGNL